MSWGSNDNVHAVITTPKAMRTTARVDVETGTNQNRSQPCLIDSSRPAIT
jgi:hypothetical protein